MWAAVVLGRREHVLPRRSSVRVVKVRRGRHLRSSIANVVTSRSIPAHVAMNRAVTVRRIIAAQREALTAMC